MKLKVVKNTKVIAPKDIATLITGFLNLADDIEKDREHLYTIGLNARNVVVYAELVSIGTSNETLISTKELFRRACIENVTSLIIAHNHPSGEVTPSSEDIEVTNKVVNAGKLLDIKVLDHVIVNKNGGFVSLKALGVIKV